MLEGPISTGVCKNLTMLILITTYRYEKLLYIYRMSVVIASARQADDQGSNPSKCPKFNSFSCVLSSLLQLRNVVGSNFDKGFHNLIMFIQKTTYKIT